MKKLILLFMATTSFISITATAQVQKVTLPNTQHSVSPNYNNIILQKWIITQSILGKKITNEYDARNLIAFPDTLKSFKIRVLKHDSITTMDFSPERINFILDEDSQIVQVSIG